jgi:8-oxo-dGTP diphosphatase
MEQTPDIKQFVAGRAFIVHEGKVLIIRESEKYKTGSNIGLYDFPGGKFKPGEYYADALKREALEECGLDIEIIKPFYVAEWGKKVKDVSQIQIIGIFFECRVQNPHVVLGADHDDYKWMPIAEYKNFSLIKENVEACEAYVKL